MPLPRDPIGREFLMLYDARGVENHLVYTTGKVMDRAWRKIADRFRAEWRTMSTNQRRQMMGVANGILQQLQGAYAEVSTLTRRELTAWASLTSRVAAEHARLASPGILTATGAIEISPQMAQAIATMPILGVPLDNGASESWFESSARNLSKGAVTALQEGLLLGEGTDQLVRRLIPPIRSAASSRSMLRAGRTSLETFVRTAVNAIQTEAQFQTYRTLPRTVSDSYIWISVLDTRTSQICIARANTVWKYADETAPRPPAHLNCRSVIFPILKALLAPRQKVYRGNGLPDMDGWLRRQPVTTQNAMLGSSRAELFRTRRITLQQLLDDRGRRVSVSELHTRYGIPQQ